MRRTARRTAVALLPLALFAATACSSGAAGGVADAADTVGGSGGSGGSGRSGAASAPAGGPATPTPARTGAGSAAESPRSGQFAYLTDEQLRTALVPESALPSGWTVIGGADDDDRGDGGDTSDKPECDAIDEMLSPGNAESVTAKGKASVIAMDTPGGGKAYAIVGVNLASFAAGDAEKLLGQTEQLLPRCADVRRTSSDGQAFSSGYVEQKSPALGDQALALSQTTRTADGRAWVHGIVAVRVGTTLVEATYVNLTGPDVVLPDEELVRMQVERVRAVLAGETPRD
ncbi:hypothetical protein [Streptodolium elevatio]